MDKKGLTFIEVITATLVIVLLSAGLFSAFVGTQRMFNRARHRLQAFNFAREAQDILRGNYQYRDSQMDPAGNPHLEAETGSNILRGEMAGLNAILTYEVIEPVADRHKEVSVHVTWDEPAI